MNSCIIGIGSNMDPDRHIRLVLDLLAAELSLMAVSGFVRTAPIGITDQPDFVNGAALVETSMGMEEFGKYLKRLEDRLGRDRTQPKFGPRNIDLDIVVWNGKIVDDDYYTRDFLRNAAAELGFRSNPESFKSNEESASGSNGNL